MNEDTAISLRYGEISLAPHTETHGSSVTVQINMYVHPLKVKKLKCRCGFEDQFSVATCLTVRQTQMLAETVLTLDNPDVYVMDHMPVTCQKCFHTACYEEFVANAEADEKEKMNWLMR